MKKISRLNYLNNPIEKNHPEINNYRIAARLLLKRLRWDLKLESWYSRKKLTTLKNKYLNQKAVILCNGPSLLKCDFKLLKNVYCFGLNKINLLFKKENFRPNCIVATNPFVIYQNRKYFNKCKINLFLNSDSLLNKVIRPKKNITFFHSTTQGFARDCSYSINEGYTVTYVALQLAFHMGFKSVAIVGADHYYDYKGQANQLVFNKKKNNSHFDSKYFLNQKFQLPDLLQSEISYKIAKQVYEAHGRKIINATSGGRLEIFERQKLFNFTRI